MKQVMSIDVEEYFQVAAFDGVIDPTRWDGIDSRVEGVTDRILQLLSDHNAKCTFFTLGWVAERYPRLIQRMVNEGHEVASHGYNHQKVTSLTPEEFHHDLSEAKKLLEDVSGQAIYGYRAPSYSFTKENDWVYDVLQSLGHTYSSSVYPIKHDLYGIPDAPRDNYNPREGFTEIPLCVLNVMGRTTHVSGGGFFRLYPYALTKHFLQRYNDSQKRPAIFYLHPWEFDPDQPRIADAPLKSKFRHYLNLNRTEQRYTQLLRDFEWGSMIDVFGDSILGDAQGSAKNAPETRRAS